MATNLKGQQRTVHIQVEKSSMVYNTEGNAEFELEVQGAFFQSQYATKLKVPEAVGKSLHQGSVANLLLRCGNLKKDKAGDTPWHYYWDFVSMGEPQVPQNTTAATPGAPRAAPMPQANGHAWPDPTRTSIERQTALKAAVEMVNGMSLQEVEPPLVLSWASSFYAWLSGQATPEPTQEAAEAVSEAEREEEDVVTEDPGLPF